MEIKIENIILRCSLGIHEYEQDIIRNIYISLLIKINRPIEELCNADILSNSLDYSCVVNKIKGLCEGKHFNLIETLIFQIRTLLLEQYSMIDSLEISIKKLGCIDGGGDVIISDIYIK